MEDWRAYQEEVAKFFRSLGCHVEVDCEYRGARGSHSLDVYICLPPRFGIKQHWVIECKDWKRRIPKERAVILKGIVDDIGADRGLLIAETGHQSGAHAQMEHTNITLTSLADLKKNAKPEILQLGLREVQRKAESIRTGITNSFLDEQSLGGNARHTSLKPGVDGALIMRIWHSANMIYQSAASVELGKFPVRLFYFEQEAAANTFSLEEFVENASTILNSMEPILTEQKSKLSTRD